MKDFRVVEKKYVIQVIEKNVKIVPNEKVLKIVPQSTVTTITKVAEQGRQGPVGPSELNWLGDYDENVTYIPLDSVLYEGSSYVCRITCKNIIPTTISHWYLLAARGTDGLNGWDSADLGTFI